VQWRREVADRPFDTIRRGDAKAKEFKEIFLGNYHHLKTEKVIGKFTRDKRRFSCKR